MWDRRSAAELLIGAPRRTRTPILLIRSQAPYPLGHGRMVSAAGFEPANLQRVELALWPAELRGHGGDDGLRSRYLQLDGLALSRLSYATMAPPPGFACRTEKLTLLARGDSNSHDLLNRKASCH